MLISNDQCWLEPIYFNKYPIPEKLGRSSFLDAYRENSIVPRFS